MAVYPYYKVPAKPKPVYKPWILARLGYKKTHKVTASFPSLIDSGADSCFCSEDVAIWLGVEFLKKDKFFKFKTRKKILTLYVAGKNYDCDFYISSELPRQTPIILGQYGFFDKFQITFNQQEEFIEVV